MAMSMKMEHQVKNNQQLELLANIPNPYLGQKSSVNFVKKMLALSLSNILYARNIFPEKDFTVRDVDGLTVKVIKGGKKRCPGAGCVVEWMTGAYEAIDRKFLRAMYLEIHERGSLIEQYITKFTYTDDHVSFDLKKGNHTSSYTDLQVESTKKAVQNLIRNILLITTTLEPLSADCSLCMKLLYTETTPPDYEPKGFKPCNDEPLPDFKCKPLSWAMGKVSTPFHGYSLRAKYTNPAAASNSASVQQASPPFCPAENSCYEKTTSVAEEPSKSAGISKSSQVKCSCGVSEKADDMLQCQICGTYQHAPCYGILRTEGAPFHHICCNCHSDDHPCTDSTLSCLSNDICQDTCLYRRALVVCANILQLTIAKLAQKLTVTASEAVTLMRRLQRDSVFKTCHQKPSQERLNYVFTVNASYLHQKLIPLHFNKSFKAKEDEELEPHVNEPKRKRSKGDSAQPQKKSRANVSQDDEELIDVEVD